MKNLLNAGLLSLMVFVVSCASDGPSGDNNWTGDNLRGKVKSVTEYSYQASLQNGKWVKGTINQAYSIKNYSPEGFKTSERRHYSDSGVLQSGFDYVYDNDGNIQRINQVGPDGNTSAYSAVDELKGKTGIVKYTDRYGSNTANSMPAGFTEMDWTDYRLMQSRAYQPNSELSTTVTYEYDGHGDVSNIQVENTHEQARDLTIKSTYPDFDEQGNWLTMYKEYVGLPVKEVMERKYEYYEEQ